MSANYGKATNLCVTIKVLWFYGNFILYLAIKGQNYSLFISKLISQFIISFFLGLYYF
jgi:hypothetical protein